MGLHGKLKSLWKHTIAVAAWFSPDSPVVVNGPSRVSLCDYLTKFMTLDRDREWTLQELAGKLMFAVRYAAQTTVLICDDRRYVPKLKAEEQGTRADGRAKVAASKGRAPAVPYPADAYWTENGIAYKGCEEGEGIDLNRLSLSRWYGAPDDPNRCSNLGNVIWRDMHSDLQERLQQKGRSAREVVFHHDAKMGPVRFTTIQDPEVGTWNTLRQEDTFTHDFKLGEADTAILEWTAEFDGKVDAIEWDTCDSDLIALYCLYHSRRTADQRARTRIWWMCSREEAVDLCMLVELTLRKDIRCQDDLMRRFASAEAIALFMIFCGNDFIKHKCYAHGFGEDPMLLAFLREDFLVTRDTPVRPIFERWLRRLHLHKLHPTVNVPLAMRLPETPLHSLDGVRAKYAEKVTKGAAKRTKGQLEAIEKLKNNWAHQMAPARARQEAAYGDDDELASATEAIQKMQAELDRELRALKTKQKEDEWTFPSAPEFEWQASVLQWVFDYWSGASEGIVPVEPTRKGQKRTSPHFAPIAAASSSSSPKRARADRDLDGAVIALWAKMVGCDPGALDSGDTPSLLVATDILRLKLDEEDEKNNDELLPIGVVLDGIQRFVLYRNARKASSGFGSFTRMIEFMPTGDVHTEAMSRQAGMSFYQKLKDGESRSTRAASEAASSLQAESSVYDSKIDKGKTAAAASSMFDDMF